MPELPDVETYRRYLNATALHQAVSKVEVPEADVLQGTSPQGLGRSLRGRCFRSTRRHGKYLFASVDADAQLVLHFGMTGRLVYSRNGDVSEPHAVVRFSFEKGSVLAYVAPRKLGMVAMTPSVEKFIDEHELGPDALSVDKSQFLELAAGRRGSTKSWLMNQEVIAGIGNIYSDEILFQAGIHPSRPINQLDDDSLAELYRSMRDVLATAIEAGADPKELPDSFLLPARRGDGECPRCGGQLKRIRVSGRRAWFCPRCQPRH